MRRKMLGKQPFRSQETVGCVMLLSSSWKEEVKLVPSWGIVVPASYISVRPSDTLHLFSIMAILTVQDYSTINKLYPKTKQFLCNSHYKSQKTRRNHSIQRKSTTLLLSEGRIAAPPLLSLLPHINYKLHFKLQQSTIFHIAVHKQMIVSIVCSLRWPLRGEFAGGQQNQVQCSSIQSLAMWIMRRSPAKEGAHPSQNVEPAQQAQGSRREGPVENVSINEQLERLTKSILQYCPVSDFLSVEAIASSPHAQIKRYRESVFWGELREGKRSGQGVMLYLNGRLYEGEWQSNFKHGKGYQRFSNGSIYKGSYVQGKPEGCGRYEWENGEIYEGEWKSGLKHGSGIWRGSKGDSYIGEWREGKAEGYGVHTWTNGDRYEGEFKECLKHGEGVERFANGDTYKGMYENGKPSGFGEYYWASGSFFKGNFKAGLRNGQGVWKRGPGRSDKYEGEWVSDKKEGYGVFTWAEGNIYKGNYLNDLRHGFGEMIYTDGRIAKGEWAQDQLQEDENEEMEHDEDCELFMPTARKYPESGLLQEGMYLLQEDQYMPAPLYHEPQRPAILNSASRHIRPRNLTRQSARSQAKSRIQMNSKGRVGLNKKMSVGTVAGKVDPRKQQKSLSSSFFLYKIHGNTDHPGSREQISRRQIRTSNTGRGRGQVQQELKYFARSKLGSHSQLH